MPFCNCVTGLVTYTFSKTSWKHVFDRCLYFFEKIIRSRAMGAQTESRAGSCATAAKVSDSFALNLNAVLTNPAHAVHSAEMSKLFGL